MGAYYFDSSALVKRYTQEVGSLWVMSRTDAQAGNEIFTALITGVEIVAALARRTRMRLISLQDATAASSVFKSHFKTQYQLVLTTVAIVEQAILHRH